MSDQFGTPHPAHGRRATGAAVVHDGVFGWMFLGLALTAGVAAYVAASGDMLAWFDEHSLAFIVLLFAEIGLVVAISAGIGRMPYQMAVFLFALYAAMNGFTLSIILEIYTTGSIASAFVVAAGMFGAMATYGYVTGRDLSNLRSILFMGLIGVILGSVVNIFWANSTCTGSSLSPASSSSAGSPPTTCRS